MPPRLDLDYVCRLCMILVDGARHGQFVPLFREEQSLEIARKIADIAGVKVISGDGLPGQVCHSCVEQVDTWQTFRQKCRDADRHFRQYLSSDFYTNSTLPSAFGDENTLVTSDCTTEYKYTKPEMSETDQPIDVSIVKEEVEIVEEHFVQAGKEEVTAEAYRPKLENGIKLSRVEGNYGNATEGKQANAPTFSEGPVWLAGVEAYTWGHWGLHTPREREVGDMGITVAYDRVAEARPRLSAPRRPGDTPVKCERSSVSDRAACEQLGLFNRQASRRSKKGFPCDMCSKALGSEGSLKVHRLNHSGVRPFHCTIDGCIKRFSQYGNLQTHVRSHLGIKPYVCAACGASFVQLANLQSHKRKHFDSMLRPHVRCYKQADASSLAR